MPRKTTICGAPTEGHAQRNFKGSWVKLLSKSVTILVLGEVTGGKGVRPLENNGRILLAF